jgi:hypothetical protein
MSSSPQSTCAVQNFTCFVSFVAALSRIRVAPCPSRSSHAARDLWHAEVAATRSLTATRCAVPRRRIRFARSGSPISSRSTATISWRVDDPQDRADLTSSIAIAHGPTGGRRFRRGRRGNLLRAARHAARGMRARGDVAGRAARRQAVAGIGRRRGSRSRAPAGALARELRARVISEHVSFTRAGDVDIGHLTQLPRTREAILAELFPCPRDVLETKLEVVRGGAATV